MADQKAHLFELLNDFHTGMLISRAADNQLIHGRPMAIAQIDRSGDIWFVTSRQSGKMREFQHDDLVALTLQSKTKFVSMSGHVQAIDDHKRVEDLWKESWRVWFPQGKADPSLILLYFKTDRAEYWDVSGIEGARYVWEMAKAYVKGRQAGSDEKQHGDVSFTH